jgi:hypothetical protein
VTNHPRKAAERALAQTLSDKAEAAFPRGDAFKKRRRLMEGHATFRCRTVLRPHSEADVVSMRAWVRSGAVSETQAGAGFQAEIKSA